MHRDEFKKTFTFNLMTDTPLYIQLSDYFKHQIQSGALKPGDRLIPETDICGALGISRTTVRQAMDSLMEDGLIVRYRGKGSFVAEEKMRRSINHLYSFSKNMRDMGHTPGSIVLEAEAIRSSRQITEKLRMADADSEVFKLRRVRCADGNPILLETTYIPYFLCRGIERTDFTEASLYTVLTNQYDLKIYHAAETLAAVLIDTEAAAHLRCGKKMPGYSIERTGHLENGYVFEYTTSVTRADKCVFRIDLYQNSPANRNPVEFERRIFL
ncbi:GntR family transcriptional regulator [Breznakiella homolactica]|uniref:GntR family transcriptional regulator n=1 Tax=Breznakiella homolactica TaxID=2798577 RepID=A0A7T7XR02_9SPIR|nr:GntR family transcriptional regulator [Breznakiella homolactica]QQO10837.1 GntR family transcriptional regulator [Breznakiella homolactica]